MMRLMTEYIVAYDIEDNKDRTKLFDELKNCGLAPIQKSVFWGFITKAEATSIQKLLEKYTDNTDRSFMIKASMCSSPKEHIIGYSKDMFAYPKSFDVL